MIAYKLFRLRKDGTLGPLFINARQRVPVGRWIKAEAHRTNGFAYRPGWHCCAKPLAPHLTMTGRIWCEVQITGVTNHVRPASQGGVWYTARWLRVSRILTAQDVHRVTHHGQAFYDEVNKVWIPW